MVTRTTVTPTLSVAVPVSTTGDATVALFNGAVTVVVGAVVSTYTGWIVNGRGPTVLPRLANESTPRTCTAKFPSIPGVNV